MNKLKVTNTKIEGVKIIQAPVHEDYRGKFMETYNEKDFQDVGLPTQWAQDNMCLSMSGVLRGLHLQKKNPQGKLIRCLFGSIYDVWVDLRKGSETFMKWEYAHLDGKRALAVYIPPGLAHGYLVTSEMSFVQYKCTTLYDKENDGGILWNDTKLGIEWPFEQGFNPVISGKDKELPTVDEFLKSLE